VAPNAAHSFAQPEPRRAVGCLLGGAVGDALGAPVEFSSLAEIRARYGPQGIQDLVPAYGVLGAITDDTQMTLFTAEGLLQALRHRRERGPWDPPVLVYHAYLRWLETQGVKPPYPHREAREGVLLGLPALHASRAPGNTCLSALRSGFMGTPAAPLNDSKGCGGVMHAAPAGLIAAGDPFALGCEVAAITHGHPTGYLAAGFLAAAVASLAAGASLRDAVAIARAGLIRRPRHAECLAAVDEAIHLAREAPATPETVERLGAGWVAEEALAIAVFAALATEEFERGVVLAVNHSGDSDSTGAITGNILGTLLGPESIPARWLDRLELRDETAWLARALATEAMGA